MKRMTKAERNRILLRTKIKEKWGEDKVTEKQTELCNICTTRIRPTGLFCDLVPITLDGNNCPYYNIPSHLPLV